MTNVGRLLIKTLENLNNKESAAVVVQMVISREGPLSEEAGNKIKELMEKMS